MRTVLTALFLCLAFLFGMLPEASGKAITGPENSYPEQKLVKIGEVTEEFESVGRIPHREITIWFYDPATGVVFYVNQNPWSAFDPDGLYLDLIVEAASIGIGIDSAIANFSSGNTGAAWGDVGFAVVDVVLAVVPGVPGVTGAARQAIKHGGNANDARKTANSAGEATPKPAGTPELVPAGGGGSPPSKPADGGGGGETPTNGGNGSGGGGSDPSGGAGPSGEGTPFVPDEAWTNNAPPNVTPGTTRVDHTKLNETTGEFEQSRVTYDEFGRQNYRVDKTDHRRPSGNGDPNDLGHSNPHLHESTYAPKGTQGHNDKTGRKQVQHNLE